MKRLPNLTPSERIKILSERFHSKPKRMEPRGMMVVWPPCPSCGSKRKPIFGECADCCRKRQFKLGMIKPIGWALHR